MGQVGHRKEKTIKMKTQHIYKLEQYKGGSTRHQCPQCGTPKSFVRYIDEQGNYIAENVGRCNRESSCAYHYTPKQYFSDHPTEGESKQPFKQIKKQKPLPPTPTKVDYINKEYVAKSFSANNTLIDFLTRYYAVDEIEVACQRYALGSTKKREVIFWQIDSERKVRTGKIMGYDECGHRQTINWVHSLLKKQGAIKEDFNLSQCLFGEHLLTQEENKDKPIALVESEKSAVICSIEFPQYVWLATGGKSQLNARADTLKGRKVVAIPDADAVEAWEEARQKYPFISLSNLFADLDEEEKKSGLDLADLVLIEKEIMLAEGNKDSAWSNIADLLFSLHNGEKTPCRAKYIARRWEAFWNGESKPIKDKVERILESMCSKNPQLTTLIDKLKLEAVR